MFRLLFVVPEALVPDELYGLRRAWILDDQSTGRNNERQLRLISRERIFGSCLCDEVVEWKEPRPFTLLWLQTGVEMNIRKSSTCQLAK
jgi:hypothetical protein